MATKKTKKEENKVVQKSAASKVVRQIIKGRVNIQATYNNTIISISDMQGNVLGWSAAGKMGFRGPKKATPYAASIIVKDAIEKAKKYDLKEVQVFVKGVGAGREAAIRALHANGLDISTIKDITPIPHNGCRPPKVRRV